jgi:hypothetical protein
MTAHPLLDSVCAHARARRSRDGAALAPPLPRAPGAAAGAPLPNEEQGEARARAHLDRTIQASPSAAPSSEPERQVVVERGGIESGASAVYARPHEEQAAHVIDEPTRSSATSSPLRDRDRTFLDSFIERTFRACRSMNRTPRTPPVNATTSPEA